jgi:CRP-like cAMP-binding protein
MAKPGLDRERRSNAVLAALSRSDFDLLQPHLEAVRVEFRQLLQSANRRVQHVYFLDRGFASVVAISGRGRQQAEVAMVGREGMTGLCVVLGVDRSPCDVFMQTEGLAQRIGANDLRACMDSSLTLLGALLRYAHAYAVQSNYTALANARGKVGERVARWLLLAHDRTDGATLCLTHEFLASMLGSRRAGVSMAMGSFEKRGMIEMTRGTVTIKDRAALEVAANGLYSVPEADAKRTLA